MSISESRHLPNYFRTTDFEAIFERHPLPDDFATGMFRWSADQVRAHQEQRFREVLQVAWQNSFYKRRWAEHDIEPGDIAGLEDLPRLPVVTVDDFKNEIDANPPFGQHQGVRPADAAHGALKIQSSGGTTGRPRPTMFGSVEWEVQGIQTARALYIQGARPGDVMQIPATLSTANLGWVYFQACFYYLGVVPITTGSGVVTPSRRQVDIAQAWGANILGAFPEYLMHLAGTARDMGVDPTSLGMKFISTYLGPDTDEGLRRSLEAAWGCPIYDNYGTHEIGVASFECQEQDGLHFNEDTIFVEVADIDTGAVLPEGRLGNLVATSLHRRHPPLIRYNLMDLVSLKPHATCACGSSMLRMGHFMGRSDDMVKLRGTNLYPMACLSAVQSDPRSTGQWLCVVDRIDHDDGPRDELVVQVEYRDGSDGLDEMRQIIADRLKVDLGVRVDVEPVPEGSLAEATNYGREGKVRRLLDRRPGYARTY